MANCDPTQQYKIVVESQLLIIIDGSNLLLATPSFSL